ncbi:MAG TPA: cytochrome D1 domain-containing protein [Pyrinomonadaceae bacterium]|jgi:hypothetical protein
MTRYLLTSALLIASFIAPAAAQDKTTTPAPQTQTATATTAQPKETTARGPQRFVGQGIEVEFTIDKTTPSAKAAELMEDEDAIVRFKITDTATKNPLAGVRPSVWLSHREGVAPDAKMCHEKIQSYLTGSLRARPDVDLNAYYVLALNQEANISVIDPLLGFGGSKLVTLVFLKSPGEDWAQTDDRERLFVSMPAINQVAVVDTNTWQVVSNVETGAKPMRVRLQPDEKYLWAATDDGATSGVTVIDAETFKVVAQIPTGAGHHEIAFSADNRFAFVTNRAVGTLSVIDVQRLAKLKDLPIGAGISDVAISPLSKMLYVTSEGDGQITVVDATAQQIVTRMALKPGVQTVRFAPGGRYGFVLNPASGGLSIFDASTNRLVQSIEIGKTPDRITFTDEFAYIRPAGATEVTMIRLATIGKEIDLLKFPAGQFAPSDARTLASSADVMTPTPEGTSVLVANPADKMIYYYQEGMSAPMGSFQNYKRDPRAVMIVDRSLREVAPGQYRANVRLPASGDYDVAFLLDQPRISDCFSARAVVNPAVKHERAAALQIEFLNRDKPLQAQTNYTLRFKLTDPVTKQPKEGLQDVRVLTSLAPGIWQKRDYARSVGAGVYELNLQVPQAGVYYFFVDSASQGVGVRQLPYMMLQATERTAAASQAQ